MRVVWVVAVAAVIGCGDSKKPLFADADVDADRCTGPDPDSDGVCDPDDKCPFVFDPGQVDLDEDGVGWACDPVESVVLPNIGAVPDVTATLDGATFGIQLAQDSASPRNVMFAATPFGRPMSDLDPWKTGVAVKGPYVSRDGALFVSTFDGTARSIGTLDAATGVYTPTHVATIDEASDFRRPLEYFVLETNDGFEVGVPSGTDLTILDGGPATSVVHASAYGPFRVAAMIHKGVGGDTVTTLVNGVPTQLGTFAAATIVARSSGVDVCTSGPSPQLHFVRAGGVTAVDLPTGCGLVLNTSFSLFSADWYFMQNGAAVALVRGATVTTVTTSASGLLAPVSTTMPVVFSGDQLEGWAVGADGSVVSFANTLLQPIRSVHGNVVHLVGRAGGQVVLMRYRGDSSVVEQATLGAADSFATVVTTAEGGAVVAAWSTTGAPTTWLVPSTSMTPTTTLVIPSGPFLGFVVGDTTVIAATFGSDPNAIYAYDEIGGARLTKLVDLPSPAPYFHAAWWDTEIPWFDYSNGTTSRFARIVYTNGIPSLYEVDIVPPTPAPFSSSSLSYFRRPNGEYAASVVPNGTMWALSDGGATLAATGVTGSLNDYWGVVGWVGEDSLGHYACRSSDPAQCWGIPPGAVNFFRRDAPGGDAFSLVTVDGSSSDARIGVLRTMGTGDRPQPIP